MPESEGRIPSPFGGRSRTGLLYELPKLLRPSTTSSISLSLVRVYPLSFVPPGKIKLSAELSEQVFLLSNPVSSLVRLLTR